MLEEGRELGVDGGGVVGQRRQQQLHWPRLVHAVHRHQELEELEASGYAEFLPLFADVDDELLDGVRLEAQITDADYSWEDGCTPREGFLRFVQLSEGDVVATQGELTTQFVVVTRGSRPSA